MPYATMLSFLESVKAFIQKTEDQPSSKKVMATLKKITQFMGDLQKDMTFTKNTVNNINIESPISTPFGGQAAL